METAYSAELNWFSFVPFLFIQINIYIVTEREYFRLFWKILYINQFFFFVAWPPGS